MLCYKGLGRKLHTIVNMNDKQIDVKYTFSSKAFFSLAKILLDQSVILYWICNVAFSQGERHMDFEGCIFTAAAGAVYERPRLFFVVVMLACILLAFPPNDYILARIG